MSGRPSQALQDAMRMVRRGITPAQAADRAGIARSTMYRSEQYKTWRAAKTLQKR